MSEPILIRQPVTIDELRLAREAVETQAEILITSNGKREVLVLMNPSVVERLMEMFNGVDCLQVFDRNREDSFHRDFGRYRVEYFLDDLHRWFDADNVQVRESEIDRQPL